jgi:hypothetical protein
MWLGDEFEEASLEIGSQGWRNADAPVQAEAPPVLELSDAELSQLAEDEGWDTSEVEAIRSLLGRAPEAPPAPTEQQRASTVVETPAPPSPPAVADEPTSAAEEAPPPAEPESFGAPPEQRSAADESIQAIAVDREAPTETSAAPSAAHRPATPTRPKAYPTADPLWLKGRRGPAATAYRRLRRLFPS